MAWGSFWRSGKTRPKQINPYATAEGTPAAEMRDINATPESKIEQVTVATIPQITRTMLRSWPFGDAWENQLENEKTSYRVLQRILVLAATMAIAVFC